MTPQLAALFDETDIIGFKQSLSSPVTYQPDGQQFFFLNPLKQVIYGKGAGEASNIATYRNILIEWDNPEMTIERQWGRALETEMPWTTCTYSGGKSLHFIISLVDPIKSAEEYINTAKLLMRVMESDMSMSNPNRISRLAGSTRDNGILQELVEVREGRVTQAELFKWLQYHPKIAKKTDKVMREIAEERAEAQYRDVSKGPRTVLPEIYRKMLEEGAMHPETNSRHESLLKFAAWIKNNWHNEAELEELLQRAADSMGIGHRNDAKSIARYFGA